MRLDERVRARLDAHDTDGAVELTLRELGPEIHRYLSATCHAQPLADDAFATFAELLWKGLPGWTGEASLRTWAYVVARSAIARERRRARRTPVALSDTAWGRLAAEVRDSTAPYLRTENKDAIQQLRATLAEEDRELLYLRVDRALPWEEIVAIVAPDDDVRRAAARLRKRFERLKRELRDRAAALGILDR